jgi:hypothetical protein
MFLRSLVASSLRPFLSISLHFSSRRTRKNYVSHTTAEFYQWGIDIIQHDLLQMYNEFFTTGRTTPPFARGIIVCIPKGNQPKTVEDYRPLTLMNTDYKIYARTTNRLKQTMNQVIHDTQYSATAGRNILDAAPAIRDVIAAGNNKRGGICIITLDFKSVFNNIVAGSCECGNEPSGSIKRGEFLD